MLIDFAVSNFKSIRDRQSLSLFRSTRRARDAEAGWIRPDISPVLAIYGANAAGKSSIIDAMHFLTEAVEDSYARWNPDGGVQREPFLLNGTHRSVPTEFDIEFLAGDGNEYRYGFVVDDERVLSEYLHLYRTRRRTVLFERELDEYKFGDSFRGPAALLRETTRANSLFISAAAAAKLEATKPAHAWLIRKLAVYAATDYRAEHSVIKERMENDSSYKEQLIRFMSGSDIGVTGVDVVKEELPPEEVQRIKRLLEAQADRGPRFEDIIGSLETELQFEHQGEDGVYALPFHAESEGTHALLSFASVALRALEEGTVCVVDEIDTSLHPAIVADLIAVFADPQINTNQAQLIFTTHDVSLLRPGTKLDSEAVWIVEKSAVGASTLISLREFGTPRKEENLERAYLSGRYGGLPYLSFTNSLAELRGSAAK